ncbi:unnamed protein product [Paramecium sonneborni]|uniref:Uncharacterized protein n=1 Tax=Paramecium sonneborni TaxID=65129 RepID=A0A8S1P4X2_9CILI|nr:unnamed protein product [Paramecium sonneborni]
MNEIRRIQEDGKTFINLEEHLYLILGKQKNIQKGLGISKSNQVSFFLKCQLKNYKKGFIFTQIHNMDHIQKNNKQLLNYLFHKVQKQVLKQSVMKKFKRDQIQDPLNKDVDDDFLRYKIDSHLQQFKF